MSSDTPTPALEAPATPLAGPLLGLRVVEFAAIGPTPFCGQLLADLGADVLRIDRAERAGQPAPVLSRGRRSIALDLKQPKDLATCLALLARADALIEGFRPGVMERLGLGPDVVLAQRPALVYGRMTGWGQTGPLAHAAGHDLNYISLSGTLHAIGTNDAPIPPLNLIGDFGGGSLYLAFGLLAAILQARTSGLGQVVDCAMVDGAASLMTMFYEMRAAGVWGDARAANLLDGGAAHYRPYRCADGRWISLGPLEPQFYAALKKRLGLGEDVLPAARQNDPAHWPAAQAAIAERIATKTRDEWSALLEGSDVCFAPVLDMAEAPLHTHNRARGSFASVDGHWVPGVAPRFSRTPGRIGSPAADIGADQASVFADWGVRRE